jgi:hypothetical protein
MKKKKHISRTGGEVSDAARETMEAYVFMLLYLQGGVYIQEVKYAD